MQNKNSIETLDMEFNISVSLGKLIEAEERGELASCIERLSQNIKLTIAENVKKFLRQKMEEEKAED